MGWFAYVLAIPLLGGAAYALHRHEAWRARIPAWLPWGLVGAGSGAVMALAAMRVLGYEW